MAWMQSHQHAYRKARECYFNFPWSFFPSFLPWRYTDYENGYPQPQAFQGQNMAWQNSPYSFSHFESSGQPLHDSSRAQTFTGEDHPLYEEEEMESASESESESESDEGVVCDLTNMEITDELREYFAQTERHKEERRRQQQLDAERLSDYVNADHGLYYNQQRTVEPPSEKPDERRKAEMKVLYGENAPKILAMEAAVQLSFNKYCDRKQPKYWPVIPLKF